MIQKPRLLLIALFALIATTLSAQSSGVGGRLVTGRLVDASTGETIPYATVSLTPEGAKDAAKFVLSEENGSITFSGIRKGKFTLKAELLGYKPVTREITMGSERINLGDIKMDPDTKMLDAAKVTDVGNAVTIKKDTIEYNASMYKLSDNDMLLDLLKKLPGIDVDSDGNITANGKTINKITIEGKTFFLDDPQLATKNIPSKIIEKVKVVEKKSDQAIFTGIDDGEEETVIDLGVRKGMMNGWFGNIMAGGGHDVPSKNNPLNDWRYQGNGFIGNFTENRQISIILNGNNTNNRGFNDMAGAMMGGMMGGGGGGGFGGWGNNSGITTSWMGGINGSWNLLDNRMELAGNYLYNGSDRLVQEVSDRDTHVSENEDLRSHNEGYNRRFTNGHRFGLRIDHRFNQNTSVLFEPQFNFGNGNYNQYSENSTTRLYKDLNNEEAVNSGYNTNNGFNKNWTASGRFLLRQRLGKAGRTMTVNMRYNFSNNDMNGFNQSYTNEIVKQEKEWVNQHIDQNQKNNSLSAGLTYTEPLWTNWFIEANYRYSWNNQTSYKNTYDITNVPANIYSYLNEIQQREDLMGRYSYIYNTVFSDSIKRDEVLNNTYSNNINNTSHNHRAGLNMMYQVDGFSAQLGVSANPTQTINITTRNGQEKKYENNVLNWAPQASLRYDINDNNNLRVNYWGRSNQPSTSQLMPVPDNTDPMRIALGNPYLQPYFNHSINGRYGFTNRTTFTSVNVSMDGGVVQNPIVSTNWYDLGGRQFSIPVNGPNSYNASLRVMLNTPIAKSPFTIFNMLMMRYNNSSTYLKVGDKLDMDKYYDKGEFNYDMFHKDMFEDNDGQLWKDNFNINKTQTLFLMERFRLTYRHELVEVNVGASTRMNKGWYQISMGSTAPTFNTTVEGSMNWNIPGGVHIIADYNYNRYDGYTTAQPDAHILNAEITKLLFKDQITLALKGYDLLGQSRSVNVSDTNNYHSESISNTLGRYVILSVTFRFGTFGGGKMMGGPGGGRGGRGGGPMMGPPPGGFGGRR